jgi:hypothetical protein
MVFGVPFQFSSQFDSKITLMTEEEAAAIRATEMFKLAESESQPITDRSRSSDSALHSAVHSTPQTTAATRSARSQSDDMTLYTNSGPLRYEEEELLQHYEQQGDLSPNQQQNTVPTHNNTRSPCDKNDSFSKEGTEVSELLTHGEEEDDDDEHHHEL